MEVVRGAGIEPARGFPHRILRVRQKQSVGSIILILNNLNLDRTIGYCYKIGLLHTFCDKFLLIDYMYWRPIIILLSFEQ